jgi:penicillin-binding protein 2B
MAKNGKTVENAFRHLKRNVQNSTQPKSHKERRSHIPLRLNILFFIIFALFVSLIIKLGYMQIADSSFYEDKIEASTKQIVKTPSARGGIYDARGKALVTNIGNPAITYTRSRTATAEDMRETAIKLVKLVNITPETLTKRDKIDYWLAKPENLEKAQARLTDQDQEDVSGNRLSEGEIYAKTVEKVTKKEYNKLSRNAKKAAYVFKQMNSASTFSTVMITSDDVSKDDIAIVGEHEAELNGVSTSTDWVRKYSKDYQLRALLGTVSTEKQGLPADQAKELLAKGYSPNDRVGTSYLEKQYESVLQGKKEESEIVMDNTGKITKQVVVTPGEKGNNLKLTIDMKFQEKVESIMKKYYDGLLKAGTAKYSDGAFVVVMNPKTGGILAMVGIGHEVSTGKTWSDALQTMQNTYDPGSVVKGATLTAGYESGAIIGNDVLVDSPVKLKDTPVKSSIFNRSGTYYLTAEKALEWSSNAYMMKLTLKMLHVNYYPNMVVGEEYKDKVFKELRKAYAQYGMGIKTGIDIPNESPGNVNRDPSQMTIGKLLDESFGQFDNYTTLQLADYASTVAMKGKRPVPHIVQGIYGNSAEGGLGKLIKKIKTKIANKVPITKTQMNIIRTGFYNVVHGTDPMHTTAMVMNTADIPISAKTGTAEAPYYPGDGTMKAAINSNIVAYAPSNNPKVSLGLMLPHLVNEEAQTNKHMAMDIINAYNRMYLKKK